MFLVECCQQNRILVFRLPHLSLPAQTQTNTLSVTFTQVPITIQMKYHFIDGTHCQHKSCPPPSPFCLFLRLLIETQNCLRYVILLSLKLFVLINKVLIGSFFCCACVVFTFSQPKMIRIRLDVVDILSNLNRISVASYGQHSLQIWLKCVCLWDLSSTLVCAPVNEFALPGETNEIEFGWPGSMR